MQYLFRQYAVHPAFYRKDGKPLIYVYDSYKIKPEEWRLLLGKNTTESLRNTEIDGLYIGLFVEENHFDFFKNSGFDDFYTYFASEGFVYGSTVSHWKSLSDFAKSQGLFFIPCVGPGYSDTRIRPWNEENFKSRQNGLYYEKMFEAATEIKPEIIAVTSFNEWHEGTQKEPAIPKKTKNFVYEDYGTKPDFYLKLTKKLVKKFLKLKEQK